MIFKKHFCLDNGETASAAGRKKRVSSQKNSVDVEGDAPTAKRRSKVTSNNESLVDSSELQSQQAGHPQTQSNDVSEIKTESSDMNQVQGDGSWNSDRNQVASEPGFFAEGGDTPYLE
ncbi:MAG: hypothetical protein RIR26_1422, partial [Pseudomonadota bacterium]